MEIGRKLTPSQILLRFFINIFCDQNFKVLFSTPCRLFEEEMVMMMMRRRMINIIKATGDFYMVSYAAILHIVMHHSSLEESIVRSLTQRTAVWETNFHIALNTNSIL